MQRGRRWAAAALVVSVTTAVTAVAAGAGAAGAVTVRAAAGEPSAGAAETGSPAGGFVPAKLPLQGAVLSTGVRLDAHTTWAAGFRIADDGQHTGFAPVVVARDSPGGQWKELPSPAPDFDGRATALAGSSPHDAWLLGDLDPRSGRFLAGHWNGTAWTATEIERPPGELTTGYLLGASAPRRGSAWAVGGASVVTDRRPSPAPGGSTEVVTRTTGLIEHWDGAAWHRLEPPAIDGDWWLNSVTEIAPDDVWAVGNTSYPDDRPVLLHYDGRGWSRVDAPAFPGLYGEYQSVAGTPGDVWVVGRAVLADKDRGHPLVAHYDGRTWTTVPVPEGVAGKLWSVTAVPGGMAAVGWDASGEQDRPLGLRYTRGRWQTLDLSVPGCPTSSYQAVVSDPGGRLTVIGAGSTAKAPQYQPLLLTGRG
ncbi:hypothetical protein [Streptomyces sp. CB01881]|uniref:hypothetical protein n=1 Tax=Streptomyces sp. CB01881 TaxID=2078691 RepID=UPI0011DF4EE5|nr:hypothetical protein [Streptomyces sp. CB01881]TYC76104.1 hypothetical protein EH183_00065 [Streptomyces sp. CB01881]